MFSTRLFSTHSQKQWSVLNEVELINGTARKVTLKILPEEYL